MRVVFMGTPEFAVAPLEHLVVNHYQVVAVYTQPDKVAGRGRTLVYSPVKETAIKWQIPVIQPVRLRKPEAVQQLADLKPDIIVVAAYGQILPQKVLDIPVYGCINIHPSLLPRYRGVSPVPATIMSGDEFAGVTIMKMDLHLDTGPMLVKAQIPVSAHDTSGSLMSRLSIISGHLLLEALPRWTAGSLPARIQDDNEASYSNMISKEDGIIDWSIPAVDIWRRVRAFLPWPGSFTRWKGKQLKILEAIPSAEESSQEPGTVIKLNDGSFGVVTGEGVLGVLKVQLEGKRAMNATDFVRGRREFPGDILPS